MRVRESPNRKELSVQVSFSQLSVRCTGSAFLNRAVNDSNCCHFSEKAFPRTILQVQPQLSAQQSVKASLTLLCTVTHHQGPSPCRSAHNCSFPSHREASPSTLGSTLLFSSSLSMLPGHIYNRSFNSCKAFLLISAAE